LIVVVWLLLQPPRGAEPNRRSKPSRGGPRLRTADAYAELDGPPRFAGDELYADGPPRDASGPVAAKQAAADAPRGVPDASAQPSKARQGDAWIVLGGLDHALYQAGLIEALLEELPPPRLALGSGPAAVNAVLITQGSRSRFQRGWEMLRQRHFLAGAALEALPLIGNVVGGTVALTEVLRALSASGPGRINGTQVQLLAGTHFVPAAPAATGMDVGGLLALSLLERGAEAAADGVRRAVEAGIARVLLLGLPLRAVDDERLAAELRRARDCGVEVCSIPYESAEDPGLLDYLLPGLGTQDRLVRDGVLAARTWLAVRRA
jgi:hypothetical protein